MRVTVRLFGPQAFRAGTRKLMLEIENNATCLQLKRRIAQQAPALAESVPASRLAINHQFAHDGQPIVEKDELALIGMTHGG